MFPGAEWEMAEPADAGFDAAALEGAREWLKESAGERPCRAVVVRAGRIVAEWNHGLGLDDRRPTASAAKSVFSCMLAIAIAEGKIGSADDHVIDYYPEMMDVPEEGGPKPGRFARPKDRAITFRQLISNTSGYLKPGEEPGAVYNYQTLGMNVLCHAIGRAYGVYDSSHPENSPGLGPVIEEKLRDPIGASWGYRYWNFEHQRGARVGIFGYYTDLDVTARDLARLGLLWLHMGCWGERQVVPADWMRRASQTSPDILAHCLREQWCYGHGFWTNDHGVLWPSLPRDSFAASGAGQIHVWVCPSRDLVVVQCPGIYTDQKDNDQGLTGRVFRALKQ